MHICAHAFHHGWHCTVSTHCSKTGKLFQKSKTSIFNFWKVSLFLIWKFVISFFVGFRIFRNWGLFCSIVYIGASRVNFHQRWNASCIAVISILSFLFEDLLLSRFPGFCTHHTITNTLFDGDYGEFLYYQLPLVKLLLTSNEPNQRLLQSVT